jgi:hypothetical protein
MTADANPDQPRPRGAAGTAALTCWWISVVTCGFAAIAAVVVASMAEDAAPFVLLVWMVVVALTWVLGWPAGWLAEHLLGRSGATPATRVAALAVLGGLLAWLIVFQLDGLDGSIWFTALGVVSAGAGRWIVVVRDRRHERLDRTPSSDPALSDREAGPLPG